MTVHEGATNTDAPLRASEAARRLHLPTKELLRLMHERKNPRRHGRWHRADNETASAPSMLDGAVGGTDAQGRSVTVAYAGEVVLDTALPFELTVHEWRAGDDPFPGRILDQLTGHHALRRRSEGLPLAVLLAAERPPGQWATAPSRVALDR